jgi:hypothetical protein
MGGCRARYQLIFRCNYDESFNCAVHYSDPSLREPFLSCMLDAVDCCVLVVSRDLPGGICRKIRILQGPGGRCSSPHRRNMPSPFWRSPNHNWYSRFSTLRISGFESHDGSLPAADKNKAHDAANSTSNSSRNKNEIEHPSGLPLPDSRKIRVFGPA